MKNKKNAASIGIIGGADGPIAVFGAGVELPLRWRIKNGINQYVYRYKRKHIEKKITAGTHTLDETIAYMKNKYGAVEVNGNIETAPEVTRIYEIREGNNSLRLEIIDVRGVIGISYSADSKTAKQFREISQDVQLYYGVSEEDIQNKTERYRDLVNVLCI